MKTRKVRPIQRSYDNFGPIQLWVDKRGKLFTFGADDPRFDWLKGEEVVVMKASALKALQEKLWEQRYLQLCA